MILIPVACNAVAGIESGKLGPCADGSHADGTNCGDAGTSGAGGTATVESGANSSSGSGLSCETPWQKRDPSTGRCYLQEYDVLDWPSAEQRCVDLGGHLVAIDSPAELGFVGGWMSSEVWTGGTDATTEGVFVWTNGQPWAFASWKDGMPVDPGGNRDCVILDGINTSVPFFECRQCTEKHAYICESAPSHL